MKKQKPYSFFYRNGLSIVVLALFISCLTAQLFSGWEEKNEERKENGKPPMALIQYMRSGHFIQATFENWESEFLQMALYVLLTVGLRQKGSAESKKLEGEEASDKPAKPNDDAPWPVRKGGIWLSLYNNSLSIAFGLLFLLSFLAHFYGSLKNNNEERLDKNLLPQSWNEYISGAQFWFESFQNWQSEFLSVASIVILSIWLRQKGSPESKPVDAPHSQTGG